MRENRQTVEEWASPYPELLRCLRDEGVREIVTLQEGEQIATVKVYGSGLRELARGDETLFHRWIKHPALEFYCAECGAPLGAKLVDGAWSVGPCATCVRLEAEALSERELDARLDAAERW